MSALPSGIVTFLFTDIEGSTRLFQQHPGAMKDALARHNALLQRAIGAHRGHVFHVLGDGFCSVFEDSGDALAAALAAQRALHEEDWGEVGAVRVRMGLHTGSAEARHDDYVSSLTLARAQRVAAAGHGGQTLLSAAAADRMRDALPSGTTLRELGVHKLRGITEPEAIHQLVAADLPSEFPPLQAEDVAAATSSPLHQLVRGQLVGRASELQQLRQHWAATQQARGQLVLLSGEPGVGKTRLAHELIVYAQLSGAVVLRGGCYEYEAATPYMPFAEALRDWISAHSADDSCAQQLGSNAFELSRLAPEIEVKIGPLPPSPPLPSNDERLRLFDHIRPLSAKIAAERGLLLFIDDLHWADHGTHRAAALFVAPPAPRSRVGAGRLPRSGTRSIAPAERRAGRMEPRTTGAAHPDRASAAGRNVRDVVRAAGPRQCLGRIRAVDPARNGRQPVFRRRGHQVADRAGPDLSRPAITGSAKRSPN